MAGFIMVRAIYLNNQLHFREGDIHMHIADRILRVGVKPQTAKFLNKLLLSY